MRISPVDAVANYPVWAPDGESVAFQDRRSGKFDIWWMRADGTQARAIVSDPDHDYLPAFSPDGTRLSFVSWRAQSDDERRARHHVLDLRTGETRRLDVPEPGTSAGLAWAADGRTVFSTRKIGEGAADIVCGTIDDRAWKNVTDDVAYDGSPVVSPDGRWIAFYSEDAASSRIIVSRPDGSERRVVVDGGHAWYPHWSPDSQWLLYTAQAGPDTKDLDLCAVRAEGGGSPITIVGGPGRQSEGSWRPRRPNP
ncbi:MAG: PD40 domain-containing protein [Planctomycetes bacterium]|nr:PD40 domain-containing protein [Planctomycetota bacterium]